MPFIIQSTNAIVVFIAVFYLPLLDVKLASNYFVALSLAQFMIILVSPLSSKLLKDRHANRDITRTIAQMFFNFLLGVMTVFLLFDWNIVALCLGLFLVFVMQVRSLSVANRQNYHSYGFTLLRGAFPSVAILSIGLLQLSINFLALMLCVIIIAIAFSNLNTYRSMFENSVLSIFTGIKESIFLSVPAVLIWLSLQLPRILIEDSSYLITFVQGTAIPIAVFSIFESRGPYLFVDMAEGKKYPIREYMIIIFVYLSSLMGSWLFIPIIAERADAYIDFNLLFLYHFITCVISLFFHINRSLYLELNEQKVFKAIVCSVPVVGVGTYMYYAAPDLCGQEIIVITYLLMLSVGIYAARDMKKKRNEKCTM